MIFTSSINEQSFNIQLLLERTYTAISTKVVPQKCKSVGNNVEGHYE